MATQANRYRTQWAAQFYAAAELTRRGYIVAFTLGNAPATDLLVQGPDEQRFTADVKGLAKPNWWFVAERENHPDYYILVLVPEEDSPTYFILTGDEMKDKIQPRTGSGIRWTTGKQYADHWDSLPQ